ncbi:hypothetical protein EZV73_09490 [Acidaminobacter sp. JC074]|uniref:hypothetical protein n=1 Tax=Acidaminobacter sp. JC074 TaxID=2530199 RepID=UPI001F0E6C0D|nr:hypothetical protein [Acidaminobacter sp. JC074]MCH4887806.1 hypothetical protein [Acidaminobacter sp. JC074]
MKRLMILVLCIMLIACQQEVVEVKDVDFNGLDDFIQALDQAEIDYESSDAISDLLRGDNVNYQIYHGQILQIYVYDDIEVLEEDANSISPNGSTITLVDDDATQSTSISWVEKPHFFLYKNLIILYAGSHQETLSFLDDIKDAKLNN